MLIVEPLRADLANFGKVSADGNWLGFNGQLGLKCTMAKMAACIGRAWSHSGLHSGRGAFHKFCFCILLIIMYKWNNFHEFESFNFLFCYIFSLLGGADDILKEWNIPNKRKVIAFCHLSLDYRHRPDT